MKIIKTILSRLFKK